MTTKLFSERAVRQGLDIERARDDVEKTYVETAHDRVLNPPKLGMHLGDDGAWPDLDAFAINMPAYVDWMGVAGTKWAVATWGVETGKPIRSLIVLFGFEERQFKAIIEGMYVTGVRTALQSVLGLTRLLPDAPETIGLFGAGFQARFQLMIIDELVPVDSFRIFDIDAETAVALADTTGESIDADVLICESPEEVVESDAIITVTDSRRPVIDDDLLEASTDIIALGTYQELSDRTVLESDHIVVDHVEQSLQRGALSELAAQGRLSSTDIDTTIGSVLVDDYRRSIRRNDRVLFVPIGLGSLDVAIANRIYEELPYHDAIGEFNFG